MPLSRIPNGAAVEVDGANGTVTIIALKPTAYADGSSEVAGRCGGSE